MNTYTKEQREQWDLVTGPGLYNVFGDAAREYLCNRLKWMVIAGKDPITVLVIGYEKDKAAFLKKMCSLCELEWPAWEPDFFTFGDKEARDGECYSRTLASEDDTELFCDFIRHAQVRKYNRVACVVNLFDGQEPDHVDKILKIPVYRGLTIEKHIELPVFNVAHTDGWSEFSKVSNKKVAGLTRSIEVTWGNEITPKAVEFLVPEFVPFRQATAFSGEMDTRKSTLALDIAAAGSVWRPWFTGAENDHKPFLTLFAGAEDDFASTIVPRFMAAGGRRECLGLLQLEVKCEQQGKDGVKEYSTPLSFDEHLELLKDKIKEINNTREWKVGLLINDPIISFFGNKSYNNPQDARDIMIGLKKLCEELQLTIINIAHFNKTQGLTAKQKTAGSKALIEAHRQAWAFDLMEDDKSTTLIAPIKHNLLKDGRSYKITTDSKEIEWEVGGGFCQKAEVGVIRFVGYSEMTADDRIEEKESKDKGNRKELKKAILSVLKDGPLPAGQVNNALQGLGSVATIRRAAQALEDEGKLRRTGTNHKNFTWELATEAKQAPIFDEVTTNDGTKPSY